MAVFYSPLSLIMSVSAVTPLTILHTSDWHLGRRLYGRLRYDEFAAFLSWLQDTMSAQQVDVLIVAGDIFDTMTPSNKAQALYYEFLGKVSKSSCQHVVIVAGNHDSPTFLDAPSNVLKFLNVHVVGTACEDLNDEVMVLDDVDGTPHCIIAAVPYLRDRDVRGSQAGESAQSKDANVIAGICAHYDEVADIAKTKQAELAKAHKRHIPIIATGHLFAAGGSTTEDDGVRELYVGSLGKVSADMFDDCFDYVALGHLHIPQRVGGRETFRYSGSPIAMGFGEARQQKQVLLIEFGSVLKNENLTPENMSESVSPQLTNAIINIDKTVEKITKKAVNQAASFMDDLFADVESIESDQHNETSIEEIYKPTNILPSTHSTLIATLLHHDTARQMQVTSLPIPKFQKLAQVSGDLETIESTIKELVHSESVWLEVTYTGDTIVNDLREKIDEITKELTVEVLITKNPRNYNKVLHQQQISETLQDLNEQEVFERCLATHNIPDEQRLTLREAYGQIVYDLHHADTQAE
jgi:exonuclease SbcD